MWQYIMLDFETGERLHLHGYISKPIQQHGYRYVCGNSGNALCCPTGYLELLRLQDRFVYLPEMPYRRWIWIEQCAMC